MKPLVTLHVKVLFKRPFRPKDPKTQVQLTTDICASELYCHINDVSSCQVCVATLWRGPGPGLGSTSSEQVSVKTLFFFLTGKCTERVRGRRRPDADQVSSIQECEQAEKLVDVVVVGVRRSTERVDNTPRYLT